MSTTFRTKNAAAKTPALQQLPSVPMERGECQQFIDELTKLQQPWNWVLRAFTQLLQLPNAKERWAPSIVKYGYGQMPLRNGAWFLPHAAQAQHGPVPLGIVLENVFEVAISDTWMQQIRGMSHQVEQTRLVPVAMLAPGALFGAFEFCDLRASIPSLRNYGVSAGSRAFKIAPHHGDPLRSPEMAFFNLKKTSPDWATWKAGMADHDALVRVYQLQDKWNATILLFTQTPPNPTSEERDLLEVVRNEAWQQSHHLREGHLKWLRHDLSPREFGIRSVVIAAASKFRRKVELALTEECLVFGNPAKLDQYGPYLHLIEKVNEDLGKRDKLQPSEVLVPLLIHDSGEPSYLSLSDDALVFGIGGDYTQIQEATEKIVELVAKEGPWHCDLSVATKKGSRSDEFWRGAIQVSPRFQELPCLKIIHKKSREKSQDNVFESCAVVIAQHLLEETGSLIQALIQIAGASIVKNTFVIGKPYSSNVRVHQRIRNLGVNIQNLFFGWKPGEFEAAYRKACAELWDKVQNHLKETPGIKHVLVLDDGGMLLETVPAEILKSHRVAGVEQTSKGLQIAKSRAFPVVGVACSMAKKKLEPSIVAETVWRKLELLLPQACAAKTMAICGLGNVGERLAEFIIDRFHLRAGGSATDRKLFVWDLRKKVLDEFPKGAAINRGSGPAEVFEQAEVVFGCTGSDLTDGIVAKLDVIKDKRTRYLVSCSSFDVEFASLVKSHRTSLNPNLSPFDLAQYENAHATRFLIPQAGFPVTFDRAPASAPIEQMQMTRGLLFAGLIQAAGLAKEKSRRSGFVALDAESQIAVVDAWRVAGVPGRDADWFAKYKFYQGIEAAIVDRESQMPKASNDTQFLGR